MWNSPKTSTDATNFGRKKKKQTTPHITAHLIHLDSALLTVV